MERFARRYPKPSSQFQYNLFNKTETLPPKKTNVFKVCFPFSLLLFFTINFYWLSMFLSCKFVFCRAYCAELGTAELRATQQRRYLFVSGSVAVFFGHQQQAAASLSF